MLGQTQIIVPLISPFTDDGAQLSEVRLARAIRWHRDRGAGGFFVGGETGECWSLAFGEKKQLIEWAIREAGDMPVIVNASAPTTAAALDLCQTAARHGAHGAIVAVPVLAALTASEAAAFSHAVRRFAGIPTAVIDPTRQWPFEPGQLSWQPLEASPFASLSVGRGGMMEEGVVDGRLLSPAAVFSVQQFRLMAPNWLKWKIRISSLFMKDRGARIAKALMQEMDCDLGSPRAPLMGLDEQGRAILKSLVADMAKEAS